MTDETTRLKSLPVHPHHEIDLSAYALRIDGMAGEPVSLTIAGLLALPQREVDDDFTCLEGWTAERLHWSGVQLSTVLELVQPDAAVQWVQIGSSADDFSLPLPLETAKTALLALTLDEGPLPPEHGAPVRLLVPGGECFTSVKWIDHIELCAEPAANTAEKIARARIGR